MTVVNKSGQRENLKAFIQFRLINYIHDVIIVISRDFEKRTVVIKLEQPENSDALVRTDFKMLVMSLSKDHATLVKL